MKRETQNSILSVIQSFFGIDKRRLKMNNNKKDIITELNEIANEFDPKIVNTSPFAGYCRQAEQLYDQVDLKFEEKPLI